jgi:DNA-binding transcriptional LysR family regulator
VNNGQALLSAAVAGLGIAYLPSFLFADAMNKGLVEDVLPELPNDIVGIYAVYPPGRFVQPKVRAFIDFLLSSFAGKDPYDW